MIERVGYHRIVRCIMPPAAQGHQCDKAKSRNDQEESSFQPTGHGFVLYAFSAKSKHRAPLIRIRQHQNPAVYPFEDRICWETEGEQHAEPVQVLKKVGCIPEEYVVCGAKVFSDEEADHRPP